MSRCWSLFLFVVLVVCVPPHCCIAAEDIEIETLRAKLAEQEKIINKLEPKIRPNRFKPLVQNTSCTESVVSLNKNSTVNIGGFVKYRYEYYTGKINSVHANPDDPRQQTGVSPAGTPAYGSSISPDGSAVRLRRAEINQADLRIFQARLTIKMDVNKHFDALVHIDLQTSDDNRSDNCHRYWVRWKNMANSGFGLKVGRDDIVFGGNYAVGQLRI